MPKLTLLLYTGELHLINRPPSSIGFFFPLFHTDDFQVELKYPGKYSVILFLCFVFDAVLFFIILDFYKVLMVFQFLVPNIFFEKDKVLLLTNLLCSSRIFYHYFFYYHNNICI